MIRLLSSVALVAILLFPACVSSRVEGRSLTAATPRYKSIAVFCDVEEESVREEVERAIAERLTQGEIRAIASLDLLTEPKIYSPAEVRAAMAAGGWEATLVVGLDEYVTEVFGRPGRVAVGASPYGGAIFLEPPLEYDRSTLRIQLEVLDRDGEEPIWVGEALASSGQVHSLDGLASEIAAKARGILEQHGILEPRKTAAPRR